MVGRDGSPRYEVAGPELVRLALQLLELLAELLTVRIAGVDLTGLTGLVAWPGPGAPDVGIGLEGGAGEVLRRDGSNQGLDRGRVGQRHQGGLDGGRGGRGGGRHQNRLVESAGGRGVEAGGRGGRGPVSLARRHHGRGLHSRRDDRPGRARALNLQTKLQISGPDWNRIGRSVQDRDRELGWKPMRNVLMV